MSSDLRLDYVSPLPPTRSGIADYSRDLLPRLEPLCDLRVIRLDDLPLTDSLEQRWRPVSANTLGQNGRLPLYQMGNNRYHIEVWRLAHETPGVLTLHDLVLHHLLIELTLAEGDYEAYRERLEADHGWLGTVAVEARRFLEPGQSATFGIAARRALLRRQRGVLVHSRWAEQSIREADEEIAVRLIPMGIPLPELPEDAASAQWRSQIGVPTGAPLIGSFGFQTPIKRTDRAIAALAAGALSNVHLAIGGEVSKSLDLEQVAAEAGVADRVHFLGFVDFKEFETAIGACDLCLNLRYPTAGETSASLLRELAVGRPAIVSDYAQFADLPDSVAVKVPPGDHEVEAIAQVVGDLLHDSERLERMSAAAREYIARRHSPDGAAAAVVEACLDLRHLEPPGDRPAHPPPPTSLVWRTMPGELEVNGAEPPWPAGEARRLRLRLHNGSIARWLSADHDAGGVMIDIHWRREPTSQPSERRWLELPHNLDPGESVDMEISLRRPLENANLLMVEPHLKKIGGFNSVGGPTWTTTLE